MIKERTEREEELYGVAEGVYYLLIDDLADAGIYAGGSDKYALRIYYEKAEFKPGLVAMIDEIETGLTDKEKETVTDRILYDKNFLG